MATTIMGEKALAHQYSVQEYLKMEAESEVRHEYHNGEVFAMAGGTINHGRITVNLLTELNLAGRREGCSTFNGDVKIWIDASNRFLYPEAAFVCGPVETSPQSDHAITNPVLIAEVLSDSSEAYDRGAKFLLYQQLPSFREYLLIDQHRPVVSVFYRNDAHIWEMRNYLGLDQNVLLQSVKTSGNAPLEIPMQSLYLNARDLEEPFA